MGGGDQCDPFGAAWHRMVFLPGADGLSESGCSRSQRCQCAEEREKAHAAISRNTVVGISGTKAPMTQQDTAHPSAGKAIGSSCVDLCVIARGQSSRSRANVRARHLSILRILAGAGRVRLSAGADGLPQTDASPSLQRLQYGNYRPQIWSLVCC